MCNPDGTRVTWLFNCLRARVLGWVDGKRSLLRAAETGDIRTVGEPFRGCGCDLDCRAVGCRDLILRRAGLQFISPRNGHGTVVAALSRRLATGYSRLEPHTQGKCCERPRGTTWRSWNSFDASAHTNAYY
jgi:hypothetical protein